MNISKINLRGTNYDIKDKLVRDSIGIPASENNSLGIAPLDASGKVPSENLPTIPEVVGDDAARAYWGGDWRMPTTEELQALGTAVNTAWTQVNNVYGILCTDKTDSSKTLFFPAAGSCYDGSVEDVGDYGYYWSSSLSTIVRKSAYGSYFDSDSAYWGDNYDRYCGFAVRPILDGSNVNGHDYVEIGGLKWATMNIGASQSSDYGLYFQWGDTQGYTASQVGSGEGKKYFGWADYKYGNGTSSPGATGMTKYNATDGLTTLELSTPVEYLHKVAVSGDYNDLSNKPILIQQLTISSNTSSICSITGSSNSGKEETIIYTNSGNSDVTVTVPTTYKTPDGAAIELTCKAGGYCEVNYLNIGGTIYARGL